MSRIPRSQARNTNSQLAKGSDGHHMTDESEHFWRAARDNERVQSRPYHR